MYLIKFIFFLIFYLLMFSSYAEIGIETGLDIPRFVSLKSDDANIRIGPSKNYPIVIKYISKNYPLMITDEYEDWRKIKDFENNQGWIHKSLIKGNRTGIIITTEKQSVKIYNTINGKAIGEIYRGNIVDLKKCNFNSCLILINNHKGWIAKENIWGVKDEETFNIGYLDSLIHLLFKSMNFISNYQSR